MISEDNEQRLKDILDLGWEIIKSKQAHGGLQLRNEAQFQYHFANILASLGEHYCIFEQDKFDIEPEEHIKTGGRSKFVDISCRLNDIVAALELKFPRGATDWTRIGIYSDLEKLESMPHNLRRFYLITDSESYQRNGTKVSQVLRTNKGLVLRPGNYGPVSIGKDGPHSFTLSETYRFNWTSENGWHFLSMRVD